MAATQDLGQINVTSSRTEVPAIQSSKPVTVIDRQQIEASHADTLAEVFKGVAGITVRDTSGNGAKAVVDLGGFGDSAASNKVVLIDGRRISNPDLAEVDWTQIPLDRIERIEIMHGGGSVLYGDGAVGGVINLITRVPESGGMVSASGGNFGTGNGSARIGGEAGALRYGINASTNSSKGYRDNSYLDRTDAGAQLEADLSDAFSWYANGNIHEDKFGLPNYLTQTQVDANPRQTTTPENFGKTFDNYIDTGIQASLAGFDAELPVSYRKRHSFAHFGGLFPFDSKSVLATRSVRPKLGYKAAVGEMQTHVQLGADIDKVRGTVSGLDSKRDRTGYYAQATLSDKHADYVLTGGARSEKVSDALTNGSSAISNRLSAYDVGASLAVMDDLRLRVNYNRSVRFPRLDERTEFLPPLYAASFRTDLLPQTGRHINTSLRYSLNDAVGKDAWLELSWQDAKLTHEIYLDPTIGFFGTNSNYADPTLHRVFTVSGYWHADDRAQIRANYTLVRATFQGGAFNGNKIPGVPQQRVGVDVTSDWTDAFSTTVQGTYVGSSYVINDQLNIRPRVNAYFLLDATASYRWQGVELFVKANNLTNRRYVSTGAYSVSSGILGLYPAATISVLGGVNYRF